MGEQGPARQRTYICSSLKSRTRTQLEARPKREYRKKYQTSTKNSGVPQLVCNLKKRDGGVVGTWEAPEKISAGKSGETGGKTGNPQRHKKQRGGTQKKIDPKRPTEKRELSGGDGDVSKKN